MTDNTTKHEIAIFAGGCFWCIEEAMMNINGIANVTPGYANCNINDPTYEKVCAGNTGCYEAVQISYDPAKICYGVLLDAFWRQIDPFDSGGQFSDRGPQYRTAIFYHNDEQKGLAIASREELEKTAGSGKVIATEVIPYKSFVAAEDYHQQYCLNFPDRYRAYKKASGRGYIE